MLDYGTYLLYRAASAAVALLPLRLLFAIGRVLGLLAYCFAPGYRQLAQRNLAIAFATEKSRGEIRRIARCHFQRLGANLLCSVKLGSMPVRKVAEHLDVENIDALHQELRAGRPAVVALTHLGCWELSAQVMPQHIDYARISTVFQALGNRFIDADIRKKRARAGVELFDRSEGFQKAIELLRSPGAIGILTDQHAGDHGLWTPFFGRLASTSPLPGLLARRTRAAVLSAAIYTNAPGRWRMVFTDRIDQPGDSVESITARLNDVVADQIRQAPEDWFWVHNRWKTPKPNFLLTHYRRGVFVPPDAPPLKPFRILVRGTNWLGDSVISMPAVRAIKRGRPDAHITVLAPEKLAPIWRALPEVDEVLVLTGKSVRRTARLIGSQAPFDVAILLPNSLRAAIEVWLAGVPRRVGFPGHHRRLLLNQVVPELPRIGPVEHQVHRYMHLARYLGAGAEVSLPPAEPRTAAGKLILGLCPGAEYGPAKRWLPERFAEVAEAVAASTNVEWVLFGTAADRATGELIAARLGDRCRNLIGRTTLEELIAELRKCALLLTNDTGTMHLATLVQVPVVAVFGSTEHRLTGPLGEGHTVIRHHVECSPCFLRECPIDFRCMKAVTAPEVVQAIARILGGTSAVDNSVASAAAPL